MKKLLLGVGLALCVVGMPQSYASSSTSSSGMSYVCFAGACALVGGAGTYAYKKWNTWLESKIVDQAVSDLTLALTSNNTINQWPEPKKTDSFCRKAQLINLRTDIITELDNILASKTERQLYGIIRPAHLNALNSALTKAKSAFAAIDISRGAVQPADVGSQAASAFASLGVSTDWSERAGKFAGSVATRAQGLVDQYAGSNPCEGTTKGQLSLVDRVVKNEMIKSIILKYKPDPDCLPVELAKKKAAKDRMEKILNRVDQAITYDAAMKPILVLKNGFDKATRINFEFFLLSLASFIPLSQ